MERTWAPVEMLLHWPWGCCSADRPIFIALRKRHSWEFRRAVASVSVTRLHPVLYLLKSCQPCTVYLSQTFDPVSVQITMILKTQKNIIFEGLMKIYWTVNGIRDYWVGSDLKDYWSYTSCRFVPSSNKGVMSVLFVSCNQHIKT